MNESQHDSKPVAIPNRCGRDGLKIVTPGDMLPEAEVVFQKHGCLIEPGETYSEVIFPAGTTREEILPRMPQSLRYKLRLPDGYIVYQVLMRYYEQSVLYYPAEEE